MTAIVGYHQDCGKVVAWRALDGYDPLVFAAHALELIHRGHLVGLHEGRVAEWCECFAPTGRELVEQGAES